MDGTIESSKLDLTYEGSIQRPNKYYDFLKDTAHCTKDLDIISGRSNIFYPKDIWEI